MSIGFGEVEGLAEFSKTLGKISRDLRRELRKEEIEAASPIAREAERLAATGISGMTRRKTVDWTKMRIGVSQQAGGFVYIAPKQRSRNRRLRRPNLVDLMTKKAMQPAINKNVGQVTTAIERAVNNAVRKAGA